MTAFAIQDEQKFLTAPLTAREEKFCREYVALAGNATQAYLRVNFAVKDTSAAEMAYRLLRKIQVQNRIKEIREEVDSREVMSIAERRLRLSAIARADQSDIWEEVPGSGGRARRLRPLDEMTPEQRLAINELSERPTDNGMAITVKMYAADKAIDLLNRMDGVYEETIKVTGEIRHVMALPDKQPSEAEWRAQYAPQLPPAPIVVSEEKP